MKRIFFTIILAATLVGCSGTNQYIVKHTADVAVAIAIETYINEGGCFDPQFNEILSDVNLLIKILTENRGKITIGEILIELNKILELHKLSTEYSESIRVAFRGFFDDVSNIGSGEEILNFRDYETVLLTLEQLKSSIQSALTVISNKNGWCGDKISELKWGWDKDSPFHLRTDIGISNINMSEATEMYETRQTIWAYARGE